MDHFVLRPVRVILVVLITFSALLGISTIFFISNSAYASGPPLSGVGAMEIAFNPDNSYVYLLNSNDSVSVLDGQNLIATIDLPTGSISRLSDLEIAADGTVYISQWFFDQVIVIRDLEIEGIIPRQRDWLPGSNGIENGPVAIAANPVNGLVYVATSWDNNQADNGVTIVDGMQVTAHVQIDNNALPQAIQVNPVSGLVYVASARSNNVTVIEGVSIINTIDVGENPIAMSIDATNGLIYVVNGGDNTVSVIDEATLTVSNPIPTNDAPIAVYADANAGLAYAVNRDSNTVSVIDGVNQNPDPIDTILVGRNPMAITADPVRELVYVANQQDGTVSVISGTGPFITSVITAGASPVALTYYPLSLTSDGEPGFIYTADFDSATVSIMQGVATQTISINQLPRLAHVSMAVSPNGDVIAANLVRHEALKMEDGNPRELTVVKTITDPLPLSNAPARAPLFEHLQVAHHPVAVDDQGQIFIADHRHQSVSILSNAFGLLEQVPLQGQPFDLESLAGTNEIYAAVGNGVQIIKREGTVTTQFLDDPALSGARALAAWPARNQMFVVTSPGEGSAKVVILDTAVEPPEVTDVIPICSVPAAIDIAQQYDLAYITCSGNDRVGVISGTNYLGAVPVGWFPQDVVVNQATGYAYVAASLSNQVAVLDGTTLLATISVPENPVALDIDTNGYVYVAAAVGDAVAVITGTELLTTIPTGAYPNAVLTAHEHIYVANAHDAMIDVFQFHPDIVDNGNHITAAVPISPGIAYGAKISDENDIDWYSIALQNPGSKLTVTLGGMAADYDMALFNPVTLGGNSNTSIETLDFSPVLNDGRIQALNSWVDLGLLRELPAHPGMGALSNNGFLRPEVLSDQIWEQGNYLIAVWGHNGAFDENQPYTLRAEVYTPTAPVSIVEPVAPITIPRSADPNIRTIILTNRERLQTQYGLAETGLLTTSLEGLASAPSVSGTVIYLDEYPDAQAAYNQWDDHRQNPRAANYVAEVIKFKLDDLVARVYTNTDYIVVVGDDTIVPFYRLPDSTLISNERRYQAPIISPTTATDARIRGGYLLSDNYYASRNPLVWKGRPLYLPELAIGRLVETPSDMITSINVYLNQGPTVTLTNGLVTGYDFVSNGAAAISNTIGNAGVTVTTLINDDWTGDELRPLLQDTDHHFISLNGHFTHWQLVAAAPDDPSPVITATEFLSTVATSNNYSLDLILSIGCQSGFNIPYLDANTTIPGPMSALAQSYIDFAQSFAGHGAAYIANTGFGYGDSDGVGFSEILASKFTQELINTSGEPVTIGQALMLAKQAYYADVGYASFGDYDEKILSEWTLYGLPMIGVTFPSPPSLLAEPETIILPTPLPTGALNNQYSTITVTINPVSYTIRTADRLASPATPIGNYYHIDRAEVIIDGYYTQTVTGDYQINPGRPWQPRLSIALPEIPGYVSHGVLFTSGTYTDNNSFDPVVSRIVSDTALVEPVFPFARWYPSPIHVLNRLQFGEVVVSEKLVVTPAQYWAHNETSGTERLYHNLNYEVYYTPVGATSDFLPPAIKRVDVVTSSLGISFSVSVTDVSGVDRVMISYDDGDAWHSLALTSTNGRWIGAGPPNVTEVFEVFVQAVDTVGNVSMSDNKGIYFSAAGIDLGPNHFALQKPGLEITYNNLLVNTGGVEDTFLISTVSSGNWLHFHHPLAVTLAPDESAIISATVVVPEDALSGTTDLLTITAASLSNPNVFDLAVNTAIVSRTTAVAFSANLTQTALPGEVVTFSHTLFNRGNAEDFFHLSIENGLLTVSSPITIPAFSSTQITLQVPIPDTAVSGTHITTRLTAVSDFSTEIQAVVTDTTYISRVIALELAPPLSLAVLPGEIVTLVHTLSNQGNYTDTALLTAVSTLNWPLAVPFSQTLAPFATESVTLVVTVPPTADIGLIDLIEVTATSMSDTSIFTVLTDSLTVGQIAGVTLDEPTQVSALPGQHITFTHILTNTGSGEDTFMLDIQNGDLVGPNLVMLASGDAINVSATLTVPHVISGTQLSTIFTAVSMVDPNITASVTDTTLVKQTIGITLSSALPGVALPGEQFQFAHIVTNSGNYTDTYEVLAVSDLNWPLSISDNVTVGPGATSVLPLTVTVPTATPFDLSDTIIITVTSITDPQVYDHITDTLTADQLVAINLTAMNQDQAARPGQTVNYSYTLTNLGNGEDTFDLEVINGSLSGDSVVTLSASESTIVSVNVSIPLTATEGTVIEVTLTAASRTDPLQFAVHTHATMVGSYNLFLPVIVKNNFQTSQYKSVVATWNY